METAKKVVGLSMAAVAVLVSGTVLFSAPAQAEVSKYKYSSSGKSGYVSIYNYPSCGYEQSSLDFSQSLSRDGSGKSTSKGGYFSSYSENQCDGSYKQCYGWVDLSNLSIVKGNGTAQGTGAVSCYTGSWYGGGYSSYTENITVNVALTCSGAYTTHSKYTNRSTSSGPWGTDTYTSTSAGSVCDATASGSIIGDVDTNITIEQAPYISAQLSDWKNRDMYITKYRP